MTEKDHQFFAPFLYFKAEGDPIKEI